MKPTPQTLYTPFTKKWEHYIELFNNHKITLGQFFKAINIDNKQQADADTRGKFYNQICYAMTQLHPPLYIDGYIVHNLLMGVSSTLISCHNSVLMGIKVILHSYKVVLQNHQIIW